MKIIFDSEEEKQEFADEMLCFFGDCPDHFSSVKELREHECQVGSCINCWIKALEKLGVKDDESANS